MNEPLHLDLFSGIGGFSIAFEAAGFRTVGFCECDPDRQRDLRHHWPRVPIVSDINNIDAIYRVVADAEKRSQLSAGEDKSSRWGDSRGHNGKLRSAPLLLTAGVPCQPASAAGKRKRKCR